jgi:hypothetical protein
LKKGDVGGFALVRLGEMPPTPLYKEGNIIYGQAPRIFYHTFLFCDRGKEIIKFYATREKSSAMITQKRSNFGTLKFRRGFSQEGKWPR